MSKSNSMHVLVTLGAIIVLGVTALSAGSALAAKGGIHGGAQTASSSITLNETDPHLGGTVTFNTSVGGLAGGEWAMVGVSCSQGGTLVYGALNTPGASFLLGGNSSLWLQRGGDADCVASLYAYGWKGGQETARTLASTPFHAAGG